MAVTEFFEPLGSNLGLLQNQEELANEAETNYICCGLFRIDSVSRAYSHQEEDPGLIPVPGHLSSSW